MPWFLLSPTSITSASPSFPKHSLYLSTSVHFTTIAQALAPTWLSCFFNSANHPLYCSSTILKKCKSDYFTHRLKTFKYYSIALRTTSRLFTEAYKAPLDLALVPLLPLISTVYSVWHVVPRACQHCSCSLECSAPTSLHSWLLSNFGLKIAPC